MRGSDCVHGGVDRAGEYEPSGQTRHDGATSSGRKTPAKGTRVAPERVQCSIVRTGDDERVIRDR